MVRIDWIVLFGVASIAGSVACGEDLSALGLKSNQASKRSTGSAARLSGSSLVFQIFVADKTSSWSPRQKADVSRNVAHSLEFIRQRSKPYGVDVSFKEETADGAFFPGVIPTATFVDPKWTEDVVRAIRHCSGNELVARLKKQFQVENVLLCLHVNKQALSYNLAHYDSVDPTYLAERMVCFTRYPDGRPTAAATYAHEILHLFGAGDLYFPYDKDTARKTMARRVFPNDVMRRVDYDMVRLTIGPFTAYRIGWLHTLKSEHKLFED